MSTNITKLDEDQFYSVWSSHFIGLAFGIELFWVRYFKQTADRHHVSMIHLMPVHAYFESKIDS